MTEPSGIAWVDHALVPRAEARVSVDDFGFRYGLTCFETMLARHGRVFRLEAHLDRLDASLRLFRVTPPDRADLRHAIAATLDANEMVDAAVRLSVSPGVGGRPALPASGPPSVVVTLAPIGERPQPVHLWVSRGVRLDSTRPWRAAKVGQFAPYLLARIEAEEQGADDAILIDEQGRLVEAATANLFVVRADTLLTPPLDTGPLPGVTRAAIIEVAASLGVAVVEQPLEAAEIPSWDGAFLTSSITGVVPVSTVRWTDQESSHQWQASEAQSLLREISAAYGSLVEFETR